MAEREIKYVVCHGDQRYLHSLGFATAPSPNGKGGPVYQHDITYEGIDYTLRICHSEHTDTRPFKPYITVIFFDSIETLLRNMVPLSFNDLQLVVLVLGTIKGSESNPVLQECIRILERVDIVKGLTWREWQFDQTGHSNNLPFQEILCRSILFVRDNSYIPSRFEFSSFCEYMINNLKNLLSFDKFNFENVTLNEILCALSCKDFIWPCTWWSISSSHKSPSTKPPIKIEVANNAKDLHTGAHHDDGDLHSLFFHEQDCSDIVDIITTLSSRNACIKHLILLNCKGTLSFGFLSSISEGLEILIILGAVLDLNDLIFPTKTASSLRVLCLRWITSTPDEVPSVIQHFKSLEYLNIRGSNFSKLPKSFSDLDRLKYLLLDEYQMIFPPPAILKRPVQEVVQYLKELQHKPTAKNRKAKIMVVGQEGAGKSTLVKSSKRKYPIGKTNPPRKTDGIEISVLKVNSTEFQVYDLAGDVEYHNTHALFFSHNCLHLAVFDLSNIPISKDSRSIDQFCRLELWLQTIASKDPNSYVIIVGTHLDHNMLTPEVPTRIRTTLFYKLKKYYFKHVTGKELTKNDECIVCNPEKFHKQQSSTLYSTTVDVTGGQSESPCSNVPHILGYHEVSGITSKNIESLKQSIKTAIKGIKRYTKTDIIPERWLHFRQSILTQLSDEGDLKKQPIATLAYIRQRATSEVEIYTEESFVAMLRFFHSQGDFLWYEDIPEMKDVVILDPQWLSNQLRTLVSYLPSVDAICEGFLHHSHLPKIWSNMSEENRSRLMTVFRSVGLCISVEDDVDMFPSQLPIGWPDRVMWPPIPESGENQTSLLLEFSFVPASFFPDLIVAINKRRDSFPSNVSPLYYRFNAVFIIKLEDQRPRKRVTHVDNPEQYTTKCQHRCRLLKDSSRATAVYSETDDSLYHRIHMEMTPHTNSLKVTIRGLHPCCQIHDMRSMIETVRSQRYPGITYKEWLICPKCELERLHNPSTFDFREAHGEFCSKGHKVGGTNEVLAGTVNTSDLVESTAVQAGRVMGETLADHICPKLFVVLPINLDSLSLKDRLVYSFIRDGYAVHLLCECPDQWHFLSSPGFRVGKPKTFFEKYGGRVSKLLRVISVLGTPFKIATPLDPHCKAGSAVASAAQNISKEMKSLLDDYLKKYPHLESSLGSPDDDLSNLKSTDGLARSELSKFLDVSCQGRYFGQLICTYVDKHNQWMWLCEEHYQQYKIVQRQ